MISTLAHIQQAAARVDRVAPLSEADFEEWFAQPELEAESNVFLITDDDDDLNEWGQAGTLDGLEGEAAGYTVLQLSRSQYAYHFLCEGAVLPAYRRQGAGNSLLICALNQARIRVFELGQDGEDDKRSPSTLKPCSRPVMPRRRAWRRHARCELLTSRY